MHIETSNFCVLLNISFKYLNWECKGDSQSCVIKMQLPTETISSLDSCTFLQKNILQTEKFLRIAADKEGFSCSGNAAEEKLRLTHAKTPASISKSGRRKLKEKNSCSYIQIFNLRNRGPRDMAW